jgi:acetoin utilization deacetylase AcuC-like enzyme
LSGTWPSALALVISLNVQRRDLTAAQRAIVAARAMDAMPERRGGNQSGKSTHFGKSRDQMATVFKVSDKSVQQAKAILAEAPDLVMQVEAGASAWPPPRPPGYHGAFARPAGACRCPA